MIKGKIFLTLILLISTTFSHFVSDKKKEKRLSSVKIRSEIQTFSGLTTWRQEKKILFIDFLKQLKPVVKHKI